ncbi:MAG TPA: hypothetical protein PL155_02220 [Candidatus Omnitrophota bacterium]|nr:hypothetical protein [Candidatus Omnitrophota bacterium]HPD84699.1 hypothetical protein [Candidatus Omnitrophota bacterium]HRZ03557.1 hypothetical protein [Candidatus Omnitrophota bacterium]
MVEPVSPEEKLLGLIRKKDQSQGKILAGKKQSAPEQKGLAQRQDSGKESGILFKIADRLLLVAVFVLLGFVAYEFLFITDDRLKSFKEPAGTTEEVAIPSAESVNPKPYSYYSEQIAKRDIFQSPVYKRTMGDAKAPEAGSELTKNLRLVGIVLDSNSQAIIEDANAQRTFFLHKGDRIREAVVEDIQESKVILNFSEQRIELTQ